MPQDELVSTVESAMQGAGIGSAQMILLTQWRNGQMGPNVGNVRQFGARVLIPHLTGCDAERPSLRRRTNADFMANPTKANTDQPQYPRQATWLGPR